MRCTLRVGCSLVALWITWFGMAGPAEASVTLPPPLGDYQFTALATDGAGQVYACDGQSVYKLSGSAFTTVASGLGTAVSGAWVDPSAFAVKGKYFLWNQGKESRQTGLRGLCPASNSRDEGWTLARTIPGQPEWRREKKGSPPQGSRLKTKASSLGRASFRPRSSHQG